MKAREKRFFSKENLGKIIIELKWKHEEDEGWNVINIPAKDLEKKIEEGEDKIAKDNALFKERLNNLEAILLKNKFGKGLEQKKNEEFKIDKDLKYKIDEDFQELSKQIAEIDELKKYDKLL